MDRTGRTGQKAQRDCICRSNRHKNRVYDGKDLSFHDHHSGLVYADDGSNHPFCCLYRNPAWVDAGRYHAFLPDPCRNRAYADSRLSPFCGLHRNPAWADAGRNHAFFPVLYKALAYVRVYVYDDENDNAFYFFFYFQINWDYRFRHVPYDLPPKIN